jgi:hypothetical protein
VGFFVFNFNFQFMKNNTNSPNPGTSADPVRALYGALQELTAIYQEAGVSPQAARTAALADFECDFGVLPLAA